jgi:hypothetical protein
VVSVKCGNRIGTGSRNRQKEQALSHVTENIIRWAVPILQPFATKEIKDGTQKSCEAEAA